MSKGLEALEKIENELKFFYHDDWDITRYPKDVIIVKKELKALELIEENLKYGYVFIGFDKDNKLLFQFADTKLYEEIKKNMTY